MRLKLNLSLLLGIIIFVLLYPNVSGQVYPLSSRYIINPMIINPAFAGGMDALNVSSSYRQQWIGIEGSPETMSVSGDIPLFDKKVGLGLFISANRYGVTRENEIRTSYSYRINMGNSDLRFGLGAGIVTTNTSFSELIAIDPGDEQFLTDSRTYVVPNFSFGIHYSYGSFFAGISIPEFLRYSFDYDKNNYALDNNLSYYSYVFNSGYIWDISPKLKYYPSVLLVYYGESTVDKIQYDLNSYFILFNRIWLGVSWRSSNILTSMLQFKPTEQLRIAYSYGYDLGSLGRYSSGSHEIVIRYTLKYRVDVQDPLVF